MPLLAGAEPFAADGGETGAVLCHGFTGNPASVRPWAESLAAAGLTVRAPRLPGHGTHWRELNLTRWEDWYGELERAFDELRGRCRSVFLMGLSMGGTLILRLAEQRPEEVAGLVAVNPSVHTERADAKLLPVLRFVLPSRPGIGSDIKAPGRTESAYDRLPLRAAYSLSRLWPKVRAELGLVTAPLLLYTSRVDHVVESSNGDIVFAGVASADKRRVVLEDSYHVATLDNDAPTIFAGSLSFVRAHTPDRSGA